jgi:prophage regulatory protein
MARTYAPGMRSKPANAVHSTLPECDKGVETRVEPQVPEPRSLEPRRMLTEAQVLDLLPFGRTTLHNLIKCGGFPRGVYVSPNRRAWFADEIARWQNAIETNNPHFDPHRGRGKGRHPRGTKHIANKDLAKKESRSSP